MSTYLEDRLTPLSADDAARYMSEAYESITGSLPTYDVLLLLLMQFGLETGNGQKAHNFNFINKKRTANSAYWQMYACGENDRTTGKSVMYYPPDPITHFEAYPTGKDGAIAYIKLLKRREDWWKALNTGDIEIFVQALGKYDPAKGIYAFFTAPINTYLSNIKGLEPRYSEVAKKYCKKQSSILSVIGGLGASYFLFRYAIKLYKERRDM